MADAQFDARRESCRILVYGLLARLFQAPADAPLLAAIKSLDTASSGLAELVPQACQELSEFFASTNDQECLEVVTADYDRLFSGASASDAQLPLALFESVWFASDADDAEDLRDDIEAILEEESVAIDPGWTTSVDHISIELSAMRVFARRTRAAFKRDEDSYARRLEREGSFFMAHVGNWTPRLAHQMRTLAGTGFYRAAATLMLEVTAADERRFSSHTEHFVLDISA